jgi:hypothetical protein
MLWGIDSFDVAPGRALSAICCSCGDGVGSKECPSCLAFTEAGAFLRLGDLATVYLYE